jgi:NADPH-dependent 2,4-dienoyl-CoA reductase/sulfur reductase-like enzyme
MASAFKKFMDMYGISFIGGVEVEGFEDRHVVTKRGERIEYNLAIAVPPHSPPEPVANSELGDPSDPLPASPKA